MKISKVPVLSGTIDDIHDPDVEDQDICEAASAVCQGLRRLFFVDAEMPDILCQAGAFVESSWSIRQSTMWAGNFGSVTNLRYMRALAEKLGLAQLTADLRASEAAVDRTDPAQVQAYFRNDFDALDPAVEQLLQDELMGRFEQDIYYQDGSDEFWEAAFAGIRALIRAEMPYEGYDDFPELHAAKARLVDAMPDYARRDEMVEMDHRLRDYHALLVQAGARYMGHDNIKGRTAGVYGLNMAKWRVADEVVRLTTPRDPLFVYTLEGVHELTVPGSDKVLARLPATNLALTTP